MSRSESLKRLVTSLGWKPEGETTASLIDQLSRMVTLKDGALSVKEAPAYVAKSGKRWFASLDEALAKGGLVTLMADVDGAVTMPKGVRATLDLNGHSITAEGTAVVNNGFLTLSNGTVESTKNVAIAVTDDSYTSINNCVVRSVEGAVITGKHSNAVVVIESGSFSASDNAVLAGNGSEGHGNNRFVINGGIFTSDIKTAGYIACGIYCPNDDTFEVNGGTFVANGGCGVCARAGKVVIDGGSFKATGDKTGKVGDSRVVVPCSALVFDSDASYPTLSDDDGITVYAGSFESDVDAVGIVGEGHVTILGGTFSSEVPVPKGYACEDAGDSHVVRRA